MPSRATRKESPKRRSPSGAARQHNTYAALLGQLTAPPHILVVALCEAAPPEEADKLTAALVMLLRDKNAADGGHGRALSSLRQLVRTDLVATPAAELVFRRNSAATRFATALARECGRGYLRATLCAPVCLACDSAVGRTFGLEIDPSRLRQMEGVDDEMVDALLASQQAALQMVVQSFVDAVLRSQMPPPLRALCGLIRQHVLERFGDEAAGAARSALSGVLFLRFLVPAVVAPAAHGVLPELPPQEAQRSLVLVSKVITSLANGVDVGAKEAFMAPLQPVVSANMEAVRSFLDAATRPPAGGAGDAAGSGGGGGGSGEDSGGGGDDGSGAADVRLDDAQLAALRLVHCALGRSADAVYESLGRASPELVALVHDAQFPRAEEPECESAVTPSTGGWGM